MSRKNKRKGNILSNAPSIAQAQFRDSEWMNGVQFDLYYNRIFQLAMSRFKWKNLPDTVDERFLEYTLFYNGFALFFKDEVMGYLALEAMIGGTLNVYRIPIDRTAYSVNGYQKRCTQDDSVIIYNNLSHTNSEMPVSVFAWKLAEMDRIIDVNLQGQKTPYIVLCDESERLTMENMYLKYSGNQPFIFGNKALNLDNIKVLPTQAPYISDKIYQLKVNYWNEILTYLGISNVSITKAERVNTDEVNRSMGGTLANRASYLDMRNQCADEINRKFGLNVHVDWNEMVDEMALQMAGEGGTDNGNLYDRD